MTEGREINTDGGDYHEIHNRGQYAEGNIYNYPPTPPESRDHSEVKLLGAVKNEVAGRLAHSLLNRVYIELDKTEDPSQVVPPWSVDIKLGNTPSQHCPDGTSIVEIFDRHEIGGRLLILGAPGSGKTTMLVQLAHELIKRASANAAHPVPVLLNLSAWKKEFKDIPSWMVSDLKVRHGVRKDIAKKWIDEGRILPLLDGLDELMSERQETCVEALNTFLPDWSGTPLVVCSRLEEYQVYKKNLELNGSVILQPLTSAQIEQYLRRAQCDWLWEAVRDDVDVMAVERGLARSPLLLTLLLLSSDNLPMDLWNQKECIAQRREILFEAYISTRFKNLYLDRLNLSASSKKKKLYKDDRKTRYWLSWLAARLIEENQTEFFIEKLQRRFLKNYQPKIILALFSGLPVGRFGGILGGVFEGILKSTKFGWLWGTQCGTTFALLFYWAYFFSDFDSDIKMVEQVQISFGKVYNYIKELLRSILLIIVFKPVIGVSYSLFSWLLWGFFKTYTDGIANLIIFSLLFQMLFGLIISFYVSEEVDIRLRDNQGVYTSLFNSLLFGIFSIPPALITLYAVQYLNNSKILGFYEELILGVSLSFIVVSMFGGLLAAIEHFALRITLWLFGYSPWNYSKFLRYCTDRGFLQRVGGGYRFVHALLRDHFAEQYDNCRGK